MPSLLRDGGIRMSVRTTSGCVDSTASSRDGRSSQEATTSIAPCPARRCSSPSRTNRLSSAITTRTATTITIVAEGRRTVHTSPRRVCAPASPDTSRPHCDRPPPPPSFGRMPGEPEMGRSSIGVVTVDDHEAFRRSIRDVIDATPGFELLGEAASGEAALALVAELSPELVLVDVRMPGMDGFETARRLRSTASRRNRDPRLVRRRRRVGLRLLRRGRLRAEEGVRPGSAPAGLGRARRAFLRLTARPPPSDSRDGSPSLDDVARRPTPSNGGRVVEDYKTTLRRLALRDDRYIESLLADERESAARSGLDPRAHALRPHRGADRDGRGAAVVHERRRRRRPRRRDARGDRRHVDRAC